MVLPIIYIILGLLFLYIGAEWLIRASTSLAIKLGISPMLVGLTIIGYGTSTPELIVNIDAVWDNYNNMALGNLLGTNFFNMAFIVGLVLLIHPVKISETARRFDIPFMAFTCLLLWVIGIRSKISLIGGMIFLFLLVIYTYAAFWFAKKNPSRKNGSHIDIPIWHMKKSLPMLPIGIAALVVGSNLLVSGSITVAHFFNISEAVIGLTIIAVGTSLPELATSVLAAIRRHPEIAIGNIIGSNIYNVLGILGIMALAKPLSFTHFSLYEFLAMASVNVLFAIVVLIRGRAGRVLGTLFLLAFVAFFSRIMIFYL